MLLETKWFNVTWCLAVKHDYTRRQINFYRMFVADFSVNS